MVTELKLPRLKNNLKAEFSDALLNIESAVEQVKFDKRVNAKTNQSYKFLCD